MQKSCHLLLVVGVFFCLLSCEQEKRNGGHISDNPRSVQEWDANLYYEMDCQLGEGAIWNDVSQELWFVDIEGRKFHVIPSKNKRLWSLNLDERIGTVVPSGSGDAILALESGVYCYDFNLKSMQLIANPLEGQDNIRLNDGKCDPSGLFWVGSMDLDQAPYQASLYSMNSEGQVKEHLDSITISNGIVWTADRKTMYYIDTPDEQVMAFDYESVAGKISNGRVVIEIGGLGYPDGMTIDAEGMLWIGLWDGNIVARFDPATGKLIGKVNVPAHNITSCAFGGSSLDTLFITTARVDMALSELDAKPLSGSIFCVVPGVKGVKSHFFNDDCSR